MVAISSRVFALLFLLCCSLCMAQPYGSYLCKQSGFTCYRVKHRDSWERLFPNPSRMDLEKRLNRMNTEIYPGMLLAIPIHSQDTDPMDFSPLPKQVSPPGEKFVFVSLNPKVLAWGAYDSNGTLEAWGPVSGGQGWCPDENRGCHTALGRFQIYGFGGEDCKSTKFPVGRGGAPMPYCMYFHGGFALHGSYEVPGYNASHGCVRMFVPDAKWLNRDFMMDETGTTVIISNEI